MVTKNQTKVVKSSLSKRNIQKFCQNKLAVVSLFGMIIMILACIFAPYLTPYAATGVEAMDLFNMNADPSLEHPFGTDQVGRDVFTMVLYGGRLSIAIGVGTALLVNLLGAALGAIAGFFGGKVDSLLVSIQEFFGIFPAILLMLLARAIFGASVATMITCWVVCGWGGAMRMVRSKVMSLKNEPFVESCRANGISSWSIMFRHMMPNTFGPILIGFIGAIATYMISEAGLAYLGLGVDPTIPTWGNIINATKSLAIIQQQPHLWLAPGLTMCAFLLFVNSVGNGLRDALDPTAK